MLDCLIIGDSIAVGTHQFKPECRAIAKGGVNTWQWNKIFKEESLDSSVVVISLGTNDHPGVKTPKELELMRSRVKATRVFWILPPCNERFCKPEVVSAVKRVAEVHGDTIIETQSMQKDGIHPSWAGYKQLAQQIK